MTFRTNPSAKEEEEEEQVGWFGWCSGAETRKHATIQQQRKPPSLSSNRMTRLVAAVRRPVSCYQYTTTVKTDGDLDDAPYAQTTALFWTHFWRSKHTGGLKGLIVYGCVCLFFYWPRVWVCKTNIGKIGHPINLFGEGQVSHGCCCCCWCCTNHKSNIQCILLVLVVLVGN